MCGRNLKNLLVRADIRRPCRFFGCRPRNKPQCLIDIVLNTATTISSAAAANSFRIRQSLSCDSRNVIHVMTCLKCQVQGVGECADPRARVYPYISTARDGVIPVASKSCAIHKHFVQNDHQLQDLHITLVEKVPGTRAKYSFLYMPTIRKRLEKRRIHRLKARLNIKREVWFLFSGSEAARGDPNPIE